MITKVVNLEVTNPKIRNVFPTMIEMSSVDVGFTFDKIMIGATIFVGNIVEEHLA